MFPNHWEHAFLFCQCVTAYTNLRDTSPFFESYPLRQSCNIAIEECSGIISQNSPINILKTLSTEIQNASVYTEDSKTTKQSEHSLFITSVKWVSYVVVFVELPGCSDLISTIKSGLIQKEFILAFLKTSVLFVVKSEYILQRKRYIFLLSTDMTT